MDCHITEKMLKEKRQFRIIVLGAGFSRPAGQPLAHELFEEVRQRAADQYGRRNVLESDLDYFIQYKRRCQGIALSRSDIDYEEFLGFLDIEHALGFRGGKTISSEGNQTQLVVKKLIGQIIHEGMPGSSAEIPRLYLEFAERLCPSDWILTFNYDTLLELALDAIDKPYRLFPNRFEYVKHGYGVVNNLRDEVVIMKLHGSIDWFDKTPYDEAMEAVGDPDYIPKWYLHFAPNSQYDIAPLLEGSQMPDDPLHRIYRLRDLDKYYGQSYVPQPPFILTPSASKVLYFETLKPLWWGIGRAGGLNLGMVIIGYSLPSHDEHARQAIYRLTDNYTEFEPDLEIGGIRNSTLKLVDLAHGEQDKQAYETRYGFVNWQRARTWLNGFSENALDFIFAEDPMI